MKRNWLLIGSIALLLLAAVWMGNSANHKPEPVTRISNTTPAGPAPQHEHSANPTAQTLPAHFEVAPSRSSLGPTLDPGTSSGITRDAYRAAREIPVTLAQVPGYCHWDRGFCARGV